MEAHDRSCSEEKRHIEEESHYFYNTQYIFSSHSDRSTDLIIVLAVFVVPTFGVIHSSVCLRRTKLYLNNIKFVLTVNHMQVRCHELANSYSRCQMMRTIRNKRIELSN